MAFEGLDNIEAISKQQKEEELSIKKLGEELGTAIPALWGVFYGFLQNPSSVSVTTFKRMVDTDDTVGSGVDFLTTCMAARIGRYQHKSTEITEWVNSAMDEIHTGFYDFVKEMFSASWAGYYTGEKVWANTELGFVVNKIIPFPPGTVMFEVDRAGQVTPDGILQYQRNWNPNMFGSSINYFGAGTGASLGFLNTGTFSRPDPFAKFGDMEFPIRSANNYSMMSVRIPRQKVIHFPYNAQGAFGSPYGRSLLRRCYKWWIVKDSVIQMMTVALDRKGTPLTVVYADPHTPIIDSDSSRVHHGEDLRQQDVGITAAQAARKAFSKIHNDSVIVLPGKKGEIYEVDTLSIESNADIFISAINKCDTGIMRGLLIPALVFGAGDGAGSFALGAEHARTWDKILDGSVSAAAQILLHQYVKELIAFNFPKKAWEKDGLGMFTRRDMTSEERDKELEVLKKADELGAIDRDDLNDLNNIRERAGLEHRTKPIPRVTDDFGDGGGDMFGERRGEKDGNDNERDDRGDSKTSDE